MTSASDLNLVLALQFFQKGDLRGAEELALKVLRVNPKTPGALHLMGVIRGIEARHHEAEIYLRQAAEIDKRNKFIVFNLAKSLSEQDKDHESLKWHKKTLQLDPQDAEAWLIYGKSLFKLHDFDGACVAFDRAIKVNPRFAEAFVNKAACLRSAQEMPQAIALYDHALSIKPDLSEAWLGRGRALEQLGEPGEALAAYEAVLRIDSQCASAWLGLGNALSKLYRHEESLKSYGRAIELRSDSAEAWVNHGNALQKLRRYEESLESYKRALELNPKYPDAWSNCGAALDEAGQSEEALACFEQALALNPHHAIAWRNRGATLSDLKRHNDALASYRKAFDNDPRLPFMLGDLIRCQLKICDWSELDTRLAALDDGLAKGEPVTHPFRVLGVLDSPAKQRLAAEIYSKARHRPSNALGAVGQYSRKEKLRIAYFSMDFREHAVSYLIAGLIELHDRSRFEVYGFSFGANTQDAMRRRLEGAFDRFIDVRKLSDIEITKLSRELEIDIAIDLGGYTQDSRPQIFSEQAAPLQINFLGYPGTLGMKGFDYLVADPVLIPESSQVHYTEKIIYMPHCYQVNDTQRRISERRLTRPEVGLPPQGFVFCCFNNGWKILPELFDSWMRILAATEGSVLWLLEDNPAATLNLKKEAERRGIDPDRLVFAPKIALGEHLARYRLADLFLDTFPYNAHTTASDALWAGVPVLTRPGESFASRVAASLLQCIGLPELIAQSPETYERLAQEIAGTPDRIHKIKERVARQRTENPLFNTQLFATHIEDAYQRIYAHHRAGLLPDHLHIGRV